MILFITLLHLQCLILRLMQAENADVGLEGKQEVEALQQFSKSISLNCHRLTKQFLSIIQNSNEQNLRQTLYLELLERAFVYKKQITPSGVCAKILSAKSYAFRCLQCQNEDNSIICIECFNKSDHMGHPYHKIEVHGGCCDCGDDEKWKSEGSCSDHNKKITNVEVDSAETELFIKQMQFFLYLSFLFTFHPTRNHKQHISKMLTSFVKFLGKFNEASVISNEMTFLLFKSQFQNYPRVKHKQSFYQLKIPVLSYLFRFYNETQYSRLLIDLFIMMFTRFDFRKYLTVEYNKAALKRPLILKSELSNISCQIYTSHKVISEVIETQQFLPIGITEDLQEKFEIIAELYVRLFLDLIYLSNLYNNVGEKYMNYHFTKGNVGDISGYERYVRSGTQYTIQYYGIQYILFTRYTQFFKYMSSNSQVLRKSIDDLVAHLKKQEDTQQMSYYIPKQRTLILLLFIYFNGHTQKAATLEFLQELGLTYIDLYRMLQAVLFVIRFYSVNLANRQTVQRYYTFFSFSLNKKPRILVSLDFQLLKFCLLSLTKFNSVSLEQENFEQQDAFYQKYETFFENSMPLPNLLSLPMNFVSNVLSENVNENQEGAYDRRKAFNVFTDYIGLLHEAIISNNAQLCLKVTYRFKSEELEKDLMQFYGSLLKTFDCIKFDDFKQICKIFLYEEDVVLQKFILECCLIQNKKMKLKSEKLNQFESFSLSYLKSKKCCELLIPYISENEKKIPLSRIPTSTKNKLVSDELKGMVFHNKFIEGITTIIKLNLQLFQKHPKIVESDLPHFCQFIKEIVKLNYTLQRAQIIKIMQFLRDRAELFKKFPDVLQNEIVKLIGEGGSLTSLIQNEKEQSKDMKEQKKIRMEQLRAKKLQKMRSKQLKALEAFTEQKDVEMKDEKQEHERRESSFCMFCKSQTQQSLSILCFSQKSNLFARSYLGCKRIIKMWTTCNHFAHKSCNKAINHYREYIHCNFCKTSCNQLLVINQKSELVEKQEEEEVSPVSQINRENLNFRNQGKNTQVQRERKLLLLRKEKRVHLATQLWQVLSESQQKIEYIAASILYGILSDYQFFVRFLSKVCCFVLRELAQSSINIDCLIESINVEIKSLELNQTTQLYWKAYKFAILSIASMLAVQRENQTSQWDIRNLQKSLPIDLVENFSSILSSIRATKHLKLLDQIRVVPCNPIPIRKLPTELKQLECEIGNCPSCSRVTNEIAVCLLCSFKSCVGCSCKNLTNHARDEHGEATIFIRVDEGWLIYVSGLKGKNRIMDSIYLNFMGEHFTLQKGRKLTRADYKLDMVGYNKAKNDLIRHRVEQEIRYAELNTSKVSDIIP